MSLFFHPRLRLALAALLTSAALMPSAQAVVFKDPALQALLDAGQADLLEQAAQRRLKAQPDDPQAAVAWTLGVLDLADPAPLRQALQALERCQQRAQPEPACSYAQALGLSLQARQGSKLKMLSQVGKVRDLLRRALDRAPEMNEARSALAQLYLALPAMAGGGEERARALVQEARDADEQRLLRARIAAHRKDWVVMERELRAVRSNKPGLLLELRLLWSELGREWMFQGELDRAQAWFEQLIKEQPRQAMGPYGLGRVLDAMGRHEQAIASFERARQMEGADSLALDHRIGMAWQAMGDKAQARAAYERYIASRRASPNNIEDCRKRLQELG